MCFLYKFHPTWGEYPDITFFVGAANSVGGLAPNIYPCFGFDHHHCAACATSNFVDRDELCSIPAEKERNFLYKSTKVVVSDLLARYLLLIAPG